MADLGGVPGARHPLWDPILSFSHTFSPKSTHVGGPRPTPPPPPHGKSWIRHCSFISLTGEMRNCRQNEEFMCGTPRQCISKSFLCDAFPDCEDASDEKNCGTGNGRNASLCYLNKIGKLLFDPTYNFKELCLHATTLSLHFGSADSQINMI